MADLIAYLLQARGSAPRPAAAKRSEPKGNLR